MNDTVKDNGLSVEQQKKLDTILSWGRLVETFRTEDPAAIKSSLYFLAMAVDEACTEFGVESSTQIDRRHYRERYLEHMGVRP